MLLCPSTDGSSRKALRQQCVEIVESAACRRFLTTKFCWFRWHVSRSARRSGVGGRASERQGTLLLLAYLLEPHMTSHASFFVHNSHCCCTTWPASALGWHGTARLRSALPSLSTVLCTPASRRGAAKPAHAAFSAELGSHLAKLCSGLPAGTYHLRAAMSHHAPSALASSFCENGQRRYVLLCAACCTSAAGGEGGSRR